MPYRFLEDIALADVAFEASGKTREEMFISAAEALFAVMVDLKDVEPSETKNIILNEDSIERLLYEWLSELVYLKDAEEFLFIKFNVKIEEGNDVFTLKAKALGENIDRKKHKLVTDVKAVTMHMFEVKRVGDLWKAVVVLDI